MRRGLTGFIGRQPELIFLKEHLQRALDGDTEVVGIVGDAGIGKTRLIEEFLRRLQPLGYSVHRGYCESYGAVAPLQPFKQIVWNLQETSSQQIDREKLTGLLTELATDGSHQRDPAETLAQVLSEVLASLSVETPVVIFIDDWQWADDASRQVLKRLSQALAGLPVMFLVASRSLDPGDPALKESSCQKLAPFDSGETRQAIKALLPGWYDLGLASQIFEQSGGNPLFVEELCRSDEDWAPNSDREAQSDPLPVPDWLYGLIRTRVEQLPAQQVQLVHLAAVIGNVVPIWLLEQISGTTVHGETVSSLAARDLVYATESADTLRFKHGITRDVVYASVGLQERRQFHRRIAEALEASGAESGLGELYEVLAHHYAGAADPSRAAHFAELAGDKALAASSLDRAPATVPLRAGGAGCADDARRDRRRW